MKKHAFTLVVSGIKEITSELSDVLYEATHGDIELNLCDGVVYLEFTRSAPTLQKAITDAITEVENAELGIRVLRIESDTANTIAKINAELLGVASER